MKRKCDVCCKEYEVDMRNYKRGWARCCSKSCAAKKREMSRLGYNPERVKRNNIKRENWVRKLDGNNYFCITEHPLSSDALGQD